MSSNSHAIKSHVWIAGTDKTLVASFDSETGKMSEVRNVDAALGRGFMCHHPSKDIVYGLHILDGDAVLGSYEIQNDGSWKLQSQLLTEATNNGTHLMVNGAGSLVALAHYWGGALSVMSLAADGSLKKVVFFNEHQGHSGVHERQNKALPHWAGFSPEGRFLYVPDLGNDQVWVYAVDGNKVYL